MNSSLYRARRGQNPDTPVIMLCRSKPQDLSTAELLSLLLGNSNAHNSNLGIARKVLSAFHNSLSEIAKCSLAQLVNRHGISLNKACAIIAFAELSRRRAAEQGLLKRCIRHTEDAIVFIRPLLQDYIYEVFGVLLLNAVMRIIDFKILFHGGIDSLAADMKIILRYALENGATTVVVCHNHPSGSVAPSPADEVFTSKLYEACKLMSINLMDHVIIGGMNYYSFSKEGKLS